MRRRPLRSLAVLLVVGVATLASQVGALAQAGSPTAIGTGGAAATVDVLATQAAVDTLRRGGNAADAAVAAAAVLGVTEPFSCGIGGGGFMVLYRASDGSVT
ncbi:MAG: gamma-glutamyltransferase, partial [Actinobacteria bacterium]|nr:gamma-glutamyltransferase [Actinomycetota bacterium]